MHVVLCALGVDESGAKHVLGLWEGATENEVACTAMLEGLSARRLKSNRSRLFILDGSKGLRSAVRNVGARSSHEKHASVRAAMHAAYKSNKE